LSERGDLTVTREANWYQELKRKHEHDPKYWVEYLKLVFSEDVGRLMDERGMNQADLAGKLGTSRAYVTRLFRGNFNPTVETLVKVSLALDARVELHLRPKEAVWTQWYDLVPAADATPEAGLWADQYSLAEVPVTGEATNGPTSTIAA
jgi:transcriptional regulator with XRE-family HTH domain